MEDCSAISKQRRESLCAADIKRMRTNFTAMFNGQDSKDFLVSMKKMTSKKRSKV